MGPDTRVITYRDHTGSGYMAVGRASFWVVVLFLLAARSFGADLFVLGVEKRPSVSTDLTILPPQPVAQPAAPWNLTEARGVVRLGAAVSPANSCFCSASGRRTA